METKHTHNYRKGTTEVTASTLIHKLAALDQECIRLRSINADLLAALKGLLFCASNDSYPMAHKPFEQAREKARAAIARAEGKE